MTPQTVLDLITASARKIGAIPQGQTLSGSEGATNFLALNGLMDQLNAERENLFYIPEVGPFNLVALQQAYPIGTGLQFNTPRPIEIQVAACIMTLAGGAKIRRDLDLITETEWNAIEDRDQAGNQLDAIYYDHNFPSGTIFVSPTPAAGTSLQLSLSVWSPLPTFAALTDPVNLPPAYWDYLVLGLAVRIAPEYSADPSLVAVLAAEAKAKMAGLNKQAIPAAVKQKSLAVVGLPQAPVAAPAPSA